MLFTYFFITIEKQKTSVYVKRNIIFYNITVWVTVLV
jgi:hypothetical protein